MTGPDVAALLRRHRFAYVGERELQDGIEQVLRAAEILFEREVDLGQAGRIDFMVGELGVEVKTRGSLAALTRQAWRYLEQPRVGELLIVTTLHRLCDLGDMRGKRVTTVHVGAGLT